MKYLVNRETKEHKILTDSMVWAHGDWRMVEADDEGWIKWQCKKNAECPLPAKSKVDLKWIYGEENFGVIAGKGWNWEGACNNGVAFYRPILPAESKPTLEETWHKIKQEAKVDVFTRLSEAVAASESIPALIAEINAILPEGYEVREKATPEAVNAQEELSEANDFRVGDFVECINDKDSSGFLIKGATYRVIGRQNGELLFHKNGPSWMTSRFKLISGQVAK